MKEEGKGGSVRERDGWAAKPLPFFFVLLNQFAFSIIQRSGSVVKNREGLGIPIT